MRHSNRHIEVMLALRSGMNQPFLCGESFLIEVGNYTETTSITSGVQWDVKFIDTVSNMARTYHCISKDTAITVLYIHCT